MKLLVMDGQSAETMFDRLAVLDVYESFIWTDRYNGCGDFEVYTAPTDELLSVLRSGNYIWSDESEHVMIIEDVKIETDPEDGNKLTVTGRSLESILDRRIVWTQTIVSGNFQNGIKKLLNENVISPAIAARKIDNFIFEESTDTRITSLKVDTQFTGDNLYDVIVSLCEDNSLGWKVTLNDSNQFVFKLYIGDDRSYSQETNPYVVFSPKFDNIAGSNYLESPKTYKNVALIAGEGEGSERITTSIETETNSGLTRRELFVDARDVSSKVYTETTETTSSSSSKKNKDDDNPMSPDYDDDNISYTTTTQTMSDADYYALLQSRGSEKLAENIYTKTFEAQVDTSRMYVYGRDFFMGDIVQIRNEYGIESRSRVTEMVTSHSVSGLESYPTLTQIDYNTGDYTVTSTSGTIHSSAGQTDTNVDEINEKLDNLPNMVPITEEMLNTYWNNVFGG